MFFNNNSLTDVQVSCTMCTNVGSCAYRCRCLNCACATSQMVPILFSLKGDHFQKAFHILTHQTTGQFYTLFCRCNNNLECVYSVNSIFDLFFTQHQSSPLWHSGHMVFLRTSVKLPFLLLAIIAVHYKSSPTSRLVSLLLFFLLSVCFANWNITLGFYVQIWVKIIDLTVLLVVICCHVFLKITNG